MSDTIAYPSLSDFPTTGNSYTEYYTLDTAKTYRWNSDASSYSEVSTNVNIGTLPLPTGASTEGTLLSVLQAVQNNRAYQETIFTDNNSGVLTFFIRRTVANQTTGLPETTYLLPDGTPYTPTGIIQVATANKDNELRSITYQANTTNGAHYTSGDYILRTDIFDITSNPASLLSTIWLNITTNNVIGITPTASHLTFVTSGADLTATNTKLDTLHTDLTTTNTNTGTTATNTTNLASYEANQTATGTITTTNANLNSGTATANSTVTFASALNKKSAVRAVIAGGGSGTSNTLLGQVSYDNSTWYNVSSFVSGASASFSANGSFSVTAASSQVVDFITGGMPYFRITASAAGTSGATVSMVAVATNPYVFTTLTPKNAAGNGQTTMANSLPVVLPSDQTVANNISQVNGTTISAQTEPVSSQALLPVMLMGDSGYTFSSSNNVASSGGTLDLSTIKGVNYEAGIYLTALSGGTSPSLDFKLQTLRLNGTSDYQDIWHCERITAINNYVYIPPQLLSGSKRLTWTTNGSPSTATMTINSRCNSGNNNHLRQFIDRTTALIDGSATDDGTTFKGVAECKNLKATVYITSATTGAFYQMLTSHNGINWRKVGTPKQVSNSDLFVELDGTTTNIDNYVKVACTTTGTTQVGSMVVIQGSN